MKKLFFAMAMVATVVGCSTDTTTDLGTNVPVEGNLVTLEADVASRTQLAENGLAVLWSAGDKIGVYTESDVNAPFELKAECAGLSHGSFEGTLTGATVTSAYYPYSAEVGTSASSAAVTVAGTQLQSGNTPNIAAHDLAVASVDGINLTFHSKLAMLAVSFKNVEGSEIEGKTLQTVKVAASDKALSGKFSLDLADATKALTTTEGYQYVDLVYTDTPAISAEVKGWALVNPAIAADDELRIYVKADDVWYGYTVKAKAAIVAGKRYNFAIDAAQCKYVPALAWAYGGQGVLPRFTGVCPAVDKDGNVYTTVNGDKHLYKINKNGELVWKTELTDEVGTDYTKGSPSIDPSGNVIYIQNGKNAFHAINAADGSKKWTFSDFFAWSSATVAGTANAKTNRTAPAVGDTNVYLGNGGTTGTVLSINKETGKRVAYLASSTASHGGPSGGASDGLALYGGVVMAYSKYLCGFGVHQSLFDNPVHTDDVYGAYAPMTYMSRYSWNMNNDRGGVVGIEIDGKKCIAFMGLEKTSSGAYNWRVAANAIDALDTSYPDFSVKAHYYDYQFTLKNVMDNNNEGGLIVGPQNELIITNKKGGSENGGGVYGIQLGSTNQLLWKFNTTCDCVGGVAVDNAGNVHVHSDDTYYYIIKPNYETGGVTEIAKAHYRYLAADFGYIPVDVYGWSRAWTSLTIGMDGRIYIGCQYNINAGGNCGMLLCVQYGGSTGVGNTSWPMMYGNPYHTCTSYPELIEKLGEK